MFISNFTRKQLLVFTAFVGLVGGMFLYYLYEQLFEPSSLTHLRSKNDFVEVEGECLDTKEFAGGIKSKLCILPGELGSTGIKQGLFEEGMTNSVLKAMYAYPDATLIDCGANVGALSTVVAATGRKVVAVDPLVEHLSYLRKGLSLLGNENNVRLLNNAVSNESGLLYPHTADKSNKAGTIMHTEEQIKSLGLTPDGPPVKIVTLMEILSTVRTPTVILKVDVEGFECRAVTKEIAEGRSGHKIPFITMEWFLVKLKPEYIECVDYLLQAGYAPYNFYFDKPFTRDELLAMPSLPTDETNRDIVWLKDSQDVEKLRP